MLDVTKIAAAVAVIPISASMGAHANPASILPVPSNPVVDENQRSCSEETKSGLGYRILRAGKATTAGRNDVILVDYVGYLARSGEVFDQNRRAVFESNELIKGFAEGVRLMNKGAVYRLCIPAKLGYGRKKQEKIPARSDLVFQVELIDFKSKSEVRKGVAALKKAQKAKVKAAKAAAKAAPSSE